jgi:O-antigen/teichoic acid export membrane protein
VDVDRSSVVVYAAQLGISVVGFVSTVYFIRTLGAAAIGAFFLFEAVASVLKMFTRLGVDTALEKRLSEITDARNATILSTGFALVLPPIAVVSLCVLFFRDWINQYIGAVVAPLLVLALFFGTIRWLFSAALRAEQRVGLSYVLDFAGEVVGVVLTLVLIFLGVGLFALLYGVIAGVVVKIALTWLALETSFGRPSLDVARSLVDFSRYNVGINVSNLAYSWLDTLVLGLFVSKELVGVYEASWKVSVIASMGASALATTIFPRVSRWHSEGRLDEIEELFTTTTTYALLLVVPATVGAAVLGADFLRLVYLFEVGGLVLAILVGEKIVQAVRLVAQQVLLGLDRPRTVFRVMFTSLAANVALNFVLVPRYGLLGAATATVSTVVVAAVLLLWSLRDSIAIRFDWRTIGWQLVSAGVMGGVVFVVQRRRPPTTELDLVAYVLLGAVTYGACVALNGEIRGRVLSLVRRSLSA